MYNTMYTPNPAAAPPPYPSQPASAAAAAAYGSPAGQIPMIQPPAPAVAAQGGMHTGYGVPAQPNQPQNLYAQATTRAGRQRASTMDGNGIPAALQRVVSHLDPNAPIRLQPSPAYYPPPPEGSNMSDTGSGIGNIGGRRRTSRGAGMGGSRQGGDNRNFVRVLEDRTLEEGWTGGGPGQGGSGWPA